MSLESNWTMSNMFFCSTKAWTAKPPFTILRRSVYLTLPEESFYAAVDQVPDFFNEAFPYFLFLILLEAFVRSYKHGRRAQIGDTVSSIGAGVISLWPKLFSYGFEVVAYIWVYQRFRICILPWNSSFVWLIGFLSVDFCFYWMHRMAHEINIFWSAHQIHHSSEEYNLSTAFRQSILQDLLGSIFYLPMALFVPPSVFYVHKQFNLMYQFWIHTELIDQLGILEWILNTPSHHRVHHGRNRYCIDKNYGGFLIIFDRIFGTFEKEKALEKVVYGLVYPVHSYNPLYLQFFHFKQVWLSLRERRGWDKFYHIFCGPNWKPGKLRLGDPNDRPDAFYNAANPIIFCPSVSLHVQLYCLLHFVLLLGFNQILIANKNTLPTWTMLLSMFFIILSLVSFGRLFEGRLIEGSVIEIFRCIIFFCIDMALYSSFEWTRCALSMTVYVWFLASLMLCICACLYSLLIRANVYKYKSTL